jgi:hypothetical protein
MLLFYFSVGKREVEGNKILKYANKAMIIELNIIGIIR